MKRMLVAPSILSADFAKLGDEIALIERLGAEYLHFDVMDGHFVPNISFGIPVLKSIARTHDMVNDVHIMISEPLKYIKKFAEAGADIITFHYEACKNEDEVFACIDMIHECGVKVGISIKPNTPAQAIEQFIDEVDLILVMSVEPGFGGQSFIDESLEKIRYFRDYIDENDLKALIEVDGGINADTGLMCKEAGADILVAGSYLFGKDDIADRMESLR